MEHKINRLNRQEVEISPVEDLMREHGILHRILLIYKNIITRIQVNGIHTPEVIYTYAHKATMILKQFIEEYHQVLEEEYVFPILEQQKEYKSLIQTLQVQHDSAKCITDEILILLEAKGRKKNLSQNQLIYLMKAFVQMYEPHSAREDTVIFPAFHQLVPPNVYSALGEKFEEIEEEKFGGNGFENILVQVKEIEKALGIYDLDQYTIQCEL